MSGSIMDAIPTVLVHGEDWSGLYLNGKLVYENHSISSETLLDCLEIPYDVRWVNEDWLFDFGSLPRTLGDVVYEDQDWDPEEDEEDIEEQIDLIFENMAIQVSEVEMKRIGW